jgi:predicted signal transduction protein with EAL and GGDEF domain
MLKIFSAEMEARITERMRLEAKLRRALDEQEGLFVFYQPIISIETGKVTAREALVRWHHKQRGWISPGGFVPVAEESGLIEKLGTFVLDRACREAARWTDEARVAVNVSAAQLGKGTLGPAVLSALARSGLSPDRLEIEVTETALLGNEADCIADLRWLRDMGVRVALDDFGTGYSSLRALQHFPVDVVKIDRSFIAPIEDDPQEAAIVAAVISLSHALGLRTVAEGIESVAQVDRLRALGCDLAQGYYFARPGPPDVVRR